MLADAVEQENSSQDSNDELNGATSYNATTAPVLRVVCGTENRTNMFVTLDSGFPFQILSPTGLW